MKVEETIKIIYFDLTTLNFGISLVQIFFSCLHSLKKKNKTIKNTTDCINLKQTDHMLSCSFNL